MQQASRGKEERKLFFSSKTTVMEVQNVGEGFGVRFMTVGMTVNTFDSQLILQNRLDLGFHPKPGGILAITSPSPPKLDKASAILFCAHLSLN